ncbi:MAG TPA: extracellular solute-binding protein [Longimicrobiaceae bacterium]|nr:extracellular solute-binding protein [Longimicrobiaceae bacterium]
MIPRAAVALPALLALAACGGGDGREVLTVYSPHGREMLQAFEQRFEALHPEVDVQAVDMGSQEVLDRLRSERANPQADVWWGAPAPMFEDAARDSLLERFAPSWAGALPPDARDPEGYWHGTYLTPEVIAYNTAAVPPDQVPRDWDEVLDPKWKGKVLIRDPMASGTMRTIFGMIVHRGLRQTGDTAAGFAWLRRLDGQTKEYVLNPTLLYQKLARQEGVVTLWDQPDIDALKARGTYPLDYVLPRSGTPLLVDGVAVVRGARNAARAREFVELVGGVPGVVAAARQFYRLPARTDVPEDSLPETLRRARRELVPEPLDWALLQEKTPEWMRWWDEHVRGKGGG